MGNPSHKGYGGDSWGPDFFDDDQKLRDDVALLGQILEMFIKNEDPGVAEAVEALTSFGRKVSIYLSSHIADSCLDNVFFIVEEIEPWPTSP